MSKTKKKVFCSLKNDWLLQRQKLHANTAHMRSGENPRQHPKGRVPARRLGIMIGITHPTLSELCSFLNISNRIRSKSSHLCISKEPFNLIWFLFRLFVSVINIAIVTFPQGTMSSNDVPLIEGSHSSSPSPNSREEIGTVFIVFVMACKRNRTQNDIVGDFLLQYRFFFWHLVIFFFRNARTTYRSLRHYMYYRLQSKPLT